MFKLILGRLEILVEVLASSDSRRSLYIRIGRRDWFFGRVC
jgi:hypothetical protein